MSKILSSVTFFAVLVTLAGCTLSDFTGQPAERPASQSFVNGFAAPGQLLPPDYIQSIIFSKGGNPDSAAIIRLNSRDRLVLKFDELSNTGSQFSAEVVHFDPDWRRSNLLPSLYLKRQFSDRFGAGTLSRANNPSYYHYSYTFPNDNLDVSLSGNYMLIIKDASSGRFLFSLPFLVFEPIGSIRSTVQEVPGFGDRFRPYHQVFIQYDYPDTLTRLPEVDLTARIVPNQFWGRTKRANVIDQSQRGQIRFHHDRNNLFVANYEVRNLGLNLRSGNFLNYIPEDNPPRIVLRPDVADLDIPQSVGRTMKFGRPTNDRDSQYALVYFTLELPERLEDRDPIYVVGAFNNWQPNALGKMEYDSTRAWYTGRAYVKEGSWQYKYVKIRQNTIDDVSLDNVFAPTSQDYLSLVYYRDFQLNYHRLVGVSYRRSR
jgi:hypothetical protein